MDSFDRSTFKKLVEAALVHKDMEKLRAAVSCMVNRISGSKDAAVLEWAQSIREILKPPEGVRFCFRNARFVPLSTQGPKEALYREETPMFGLADLMLSDSIREAISDLVEEHRNRDRLLAAGLPPRNRLLLWGPPGNGKTSLAEALAFELGLSLRVAETQNVVVSYLGKTGQNLCKLLEEASDSPCVLCLDEFDALGHSRGGAESSEKELSRSVNLLLQSMDRIPCDVVLVATTNRSDVLDGAFFRRFDLVLEMKGPNPDEAYRFLKSRLDPEGRDPDEAGELASFFVKALRVALRSRAAARGTEPQICYGDLEKLALSVRRHRVLYPETLERDKLKSTEWALPHIEGMLDKYDARLPKGPGEEAVKT